MTEADWLTGNHPDPMLAFIQDKASGRKLRLFTAACCRRVQHLLDSDSDADQDTLAELERGADGPADPARLGAVGGSPSLPVVFAAGSPGEPAATATADICAELEGAANGDRTHPLGVGDYYAAEAAERAAQCRLLRDIIGNPLRPAPSDPRWRTTPVLDLARTMYESGDFAPMPILADAMEEAGCDHLDTLAHCRGPGPHVRGCWVVDLILGKS